MKANLECHGYIGKSLTTCWLVSGTPVRILECTEGIHDYGLKGSLWISLKSTSASMISSLIPKRQNLRIIIKCIKLRKLDISYALGLVGLKSFVIDGKVQESKG